MTSSHVLPRPLITGERMSREEFLSRWEDLPDLKNAELIEGIVYVPSPLSREHGKSDTLSVWWLAQYAFHTPGLEASNNATWMILESLPQPDATLVIRPEYGGQARLHGKYGEGGPDLVVEICITSTEVDFGPKLALYQRAGVREYITVESFMKGKITWRMLVDGSYRTLAPGDDGNYRSRVFPGLWLNTAAFWAGDGIGLETLLREGLASPEHAAFVQELLQARKTT